MSWYEHEAPLPWSIEFAETEDSGIEYEGDGASYRVRDAEGHDVMHDQDYYNLAPNRATAEMLVRLANATRENA